MSGGTCPRENMSRGNVRIPSCQCLTAHVCVNVVIFLFFSGFAVSINETKFIY